MRSKADSLTLAYFKWSHQTKANDEVQAKIYLVVFIIIIFFLSFPLRKRWYSKYKRVTKAIVLFTSLFFFSIMFASFYIFFDTLLNEDILFDVQICIWKIYQTNSYCALKIEKSKKQIHYRIAVKMKRVEVNH